MVFTDRTFFDSTVFLQYFSFNCTPAWKIRKTWECRTDPCQPVSRPKPCQSWGCSSQSRQELAATQSTRSFGHFWIQTNIFLMHFPEDFKGDCLWFNNKSWIDNSRWLRKQNSNCSHGLSCASGMQRSRTDCKRLHTKWFLFSFAARLGFISALGKRGGSWHGCRSHPKRFVGGVDDWSHMAQSITWHATFGLATHTDKLPALKPVCCSK